MDVKKGWKRMIQRFHRHSDEEIKKILFGKNYIPPLVSEFPDTDEEEEPYIARLLREDPKLREDVAAGRIVLSSTGNKVFYHRNPSWFLHQAEQLEKNVHGYPPRMLASMKELGTYKGYIANPKTDAERISNEAWASDLSCDYEDALFEIAKRPEQGKFGQVKGNVMPAPGTQGPTTFTEAAKLRTRQLGLA